MLQIIFYIICILAMLLLVINNIMNIKYERERHKKDMEFLNKMIKNIESEDK